MSLPITVVKCPTSKYSVKCPYAMTPTRIVVHNTANDASAMNEISYMLGNNNKTSYHYAVDDTRAVQGIPLNRNAWHAGDGSKGIGNRQGIAIEICYSKSGGTRFMKSEQNAAKLVAMLLKQYGWGMNKVTKHQDYNGKRCPHRTIDLGWERFLTMVQKELTALNTPTTGEIYRVRKSWNDINSQIEAFKDLTNAKKLCDGNSAYKVYDYKGEQVYPVRKTHEQIAKEVIEGLWGNGEERKRRLTQAGYDYKAIQSIVNKLL